MATQTIAAHQRSGKPISPPRREQILIVVHGDGFIELYAQHHIDARIIMAPWLDGNPDGEIAAEQYIESILPHCYRDVYWPGNKRAAAMARRIRPSNIAKRNWEMEMLQAIERAGGLSQSRAADTHLVLREHETPGAVVLDAAVRSFKPIEPIVLRWDFPLWQVDSSLDPAALKQERPRRTRQPKTEDSTPKAPEWTREARTAEAA